MEQYIRDYATGYYNDDRVKVIRKLMKNEILADCDAAGFMLSYDKVMPESLRCWRKRLIGNRLDEEEERRLADELLKADPVGWTDEQALYILARRLMDMEKSARNNTERSIMRIMLERCFPDVMARMEELHVQDVNDDIWFSRFLDRALLEDEAELKEESQADKD